MTREDLIEEYEKFDYGSNKSLQRAIADYIDWLELRIVDLENSKVYNRNESLSCPSGENCKSWLSKCKMCKRNMYLKDYYIKEETK